MKRLSLITATTLVSAGLVVSAAPAATTTITAANAPTGTHLHSGTIGCTLDSAQAVTCNSFELAGVGNSDAEATLVANYTATVDCRNRGGNVVEVKSQVEGAESTSGDIEPKNGRLIVPEVSSAPAPSASEFERQAVCPNGNWTRVMRPGTATISSFTYEMTFDGFRDPYITITGP